jgi:dihydrofolate synthase/folylpolyglutamate synthase
MAAVIDHWYAAGLDVFRGADASTLRRALQGQGLDAGEAHASVAAALAAARQAARPGDRIVLFGSFYTVAEALALNV